MFTKEIMTAKPVYVMPGNSVKHAAQIMFDHSISGLPVLDDEARLVGIISEGDLLSRCELEPDAPADAGAEVEPHAFLKHHSWNVGDVMTRDVVAVTEDTSVVEAARLMERHRVGRLPVMRGDRLVGIVSRKNILRAITAAVPPSIAQGDDAIRCSVKARLAESPILAGADVAVTVSDRVVHLHGTVGSAAVRAVARTITESVEGIAGVCDHMQLSETTES